MKSEDSGGRHAPFWEDYRPHLIPSGSEDYLGVIVVNLPEESPVRPGDLSKRGVRPLLSSERRLFRFGGRSLDVEVR